MLWLQPTFWILRSPPFAALARLSIFLSRASRLYLGTSRRPLRCAGLAYDRYARARLPAGSDYDTNGCAAYAFVSQDGMWIGALRLCFSRAAAWVIPL